MGATTSKPVSSDLREFDTFSVSAHYGGKVRLLNEPPLSKGVHTVRAANGVRAKTLRGAMHNLFLGCGNKPTKKPEDYFGCVQYNLGKNTWWRRGRDGIYGRKCIGQTLATIRACGYRLEAGGMTVQRKSYNISTFVFSYSIAYF